MMYLESVIIIKGQEAGIILAIFIMAAISPTWLDCAGPGTHMALLKLLSKLTLIPLPQYAFYFPLLKHPLSVYTFIVWSWRTSPGECCLLAGKREIWVGLGR